MKSIGKKSSIFLLRALVKEVIAEGGLKISKEERTKITTTIIKSAIEKYLSVIDSFNSWLEKSGIEKITPLHATGSSFYWEIDIADNPEAVYGDIDYLVSFPVNLDSHNINELHKAERESEKKYTDLLERWLRKKSHSDVDVEMTLKSSPLMIIINTDFGKVQVDTVITHPKYAEWMKGRYTPERGVKGLFTGNIYKTLSDMFDLSIGTKGVFAKRKDGEKVSIRKMAGVEIEMISTNYETFVFDILKHLVPRGAKIHPLLDKYKGGSLEEVRISDLLNSISGLFLSLEMTSSKDFDYQVLSSRFLTDLEKNLDANIQKKINLGLEESLVKKLLSSKTEIINKARSILRKNI